MTGEMQTFLSPRAQAWWDAVLPMLSRAVADLQVSDARAAQVLDVWMAEPWLLRHVVAAAQTYRHGAARKPDPWRADMAEADADAKRIFSEATVLGDRLTRLLDRMKDVPDLPAHATVVAASYAAFDAMQELKKIADAMEAAAGPNVGQRPKEPERAARLQLAIDLADLWATWGKQEAFWRVRNLDRPKQTDRRKIFGALLSAVYRVLWLKAHSNQTTAPEDMPDFDEAMRKARRHIGKF
jgi:hypothetical protein